jgi:Fe-coproporphyrin III synthase
MLNITQLLCGSRIGEEADHIARSRRVSTCQAPRPVVAWAVTQASNLPAPGSHSRSLSEAAAGELNFTEGLQLLNDLRRFDIPAILFTGGEPLVREDCLDLVEHASEIGLNATLATNGTAITGAVADRLAALNIGYVAISLEGSEERHDRLHARKGAYRAALNGIRRCRARGIPTALRFSLHQQNYMDIDAVFDLCIAEDVQRLSVYHPAAGAQADVHKTDLTHAQTREVVDRIFARTQAEYDAGHALEVLTIGNHSDASYLLLRLEKTDPQRFHEARRLLAAAGGNRAGCEVASIDPIGNVHYDPDSWHYTCGNVRQRSFAEIWDNPEDERLRILRDRVDYLPDRCQVCRFVGICNGNSRTRAEAATGDWLSPDPACYIRSADLGLTVPSECIIPDLHSERHQHQWTSDAM